MSADWMLIVGPRLGAMCRPRKLASGTLTLGCSGSAALELLHTSGPIIERANLYLGHQAVTRLRLVRDAAMAPEPESLPALGKQGAETLDASLAEFPAGKVRTALDALAKAMG
jgi:hypothetical protein